MMQSDRQGPINDTKLPAAGAIGTGWVDRGRDETKTDRHSGFERKRDGPAEAKSEERASLVFRRSGGGSVLGLVRRLDSRV